VLELSLVEGTDALIGDSQLIQIAREANDAGIRYVMEADYHNRGARVYNELGRYTFREQTDSA